MAVTRETLRLVAGLRRQLNDLTNAQIRDLVAAWAAAWDEVAPDLQSALNELVDAAEKGRVTRAMMLKSSKLQQALAAIAGRLEDLAGQANVRITGDIATVVQQAGQLQDHIVASQLPAQERNSIAAWSRVSDDAIAAIVTRTTEQITATSRPLGAQAARAVRRELIRGIAVGANPRATAARMVTRAEGRFNGGLTRALAIARTETLDAHRAAALLSRKANADVLTGWAWHCEFSNRTCPACIAMDGAVFSIDTPGPNDHVNGRCTAVPITKPWAELGIDQAEPQSVFVSARAQFEQASEHTQRAILGPARFNAWQGGHYPVDSWAVTRSNSGWRDSVQVSRAPSGGRRSDRLAS